MHNLVQTKDYLKLCRFKYGYVVVCTTCSVLWLLTNAMGVMAVKTLAQWLLLPSAIVRVVNSLAHFTLAIMVMATDPAVGENF